MHSLEAVKDITNWEDVLRKWGRKYQPPETLPEEKPDPKFVSVERPTLHGGGLPLTLEDKWG